MAKRVPVTARIGLGLILIGFALFGGWRYWMATRTWVPLDVPISMSRGHVRTPEFEINLEGTFAVYLQVERKFDFEGVPCLLSWNFDTCKETPDGVVNVSWKLSNGEKIVAQGVSDAPNGLIGGTATMSRELGRFWAGTGEHYVLDLEVVKDGSRLNPGHPRLRIEQTGYDWSYESEGDSILAFSLFLGAIGAALLATAIVARRRERQDEWRVPLTAPGPLSPELHMETDLAAAQAAPPGRGTSLPWSTWLGLALVVIGFAFFVAVQHWMNTRTFVAVDIPVSLASGHIRTGPFPINLREGYLITIDTRPWWNVDPQCVSYNILQSRWVLYRQGRVVERHDEPIRNGNYSGFDGEPGTYDLDVELLADASCLNPAHPRLRVETSKRDYEFYASVIQWPAALCAAVGGSLLVLGWIGRFVRPSAPTLSITGCESAGQNVQWAQKLPLRQPFSGLRPFGLVGGMTFALLAMTLMILTSLHYKSVGLQVQLLKPGTVPAKSDTWSVPLVVLVKDGGPGKHPNLYVNSKPVAWEDFDRTLKQELSLRREWIVYVGGDDAVGWANITTVIDIARRYHAKVFLLTGDAGNATTH